MIKIAAIPLAAILIFVGLAGARAQPTSLSKVDFQFTSESGVAPKSAFVSLPNEKEAYRLSLEPDYDVAHRVVVLGIVLQHASDGATLRTYSTRPARHTDIKNTFLLRRTSLMECANRSMARPESWRSKHPE
jgi:hypothetical protein